MIRTSLRSAVLAIGESKLGFKVLSKEEKAAQLTQENIDHKTAFLSLLSTLKLVPKRIRMQTLSKAMCKGKVTKINDDYKSNVGN